MHTIYKITNKITGLMYIGRSGRCIHQRMREHIRYSKTKNSYLYNSIRKYGSENFIIEIIDSASADIICDREREWIIKLNTIQPNGMNEHAGGRGGVLHASSELRQRLSNSKKRYYEQNIHHGKGKPLTEEHKQKISMGHKRFLMSNSHPRKGKTSTNKRGSSKAYLIQNIASGEEFTVINLLSFCKEHNLSQGNMFNVALGKFTQHKGWKASVILLPSSPTSSALGR